MLKIQAQSKTVQRNLLSFKEMVYQHRKAEKERHKTFVGFVHKETGAMTFEKDPHSADWEKVVVIVDLDKHEVSARKCKDLTPKAHQIMAETLNLLKEVSEQVLDLKELSYFEVEPIEENSVVHEAWHKLDRLGAEKLLQNEPPGTYIFRKDAEVKILQSQLAHEHKRPVECLTLSYVDKEKGVHDCTLVRFYNRWQIYEDPTLTGSTYESVAELLANFQPKLGTPL